MTFLQRPDFGRRLDEASRERLAATDGASRARCDLAIVVVDGLSALAVQTHTPSFLEALLNDLDADEAAWTWRYAYAAVDGWTRRSSKYYPECVPALHAAAERAIGLREANLVSEVSAEGMYDARARRFAEYESA